MLLLRGYKLFCCYYKSCYYKSCHSGKNTYACHSDEGQNLFCSPSCHSDEGQNLININNRFRVKHGMTEKKHRVTEKKHRVTEEKHEITGESMRITACLKKLYFYINYKIK